MRGLLMAAELTPIRNGGRVRPKMIVIRPVRLARATSESPRMGHCRSCAPVRGTVLLAAFTSVCGTFRADQDIILRLVALMLLVAPCGAFLLCGGSRGPERVQVRSRVLRARLELLRA